MTQVFCHVEEWGEIFLFPFYRISFDDNFGFGLKTRITESKSEMIKVAAVNATHSLTLILATENHSLNDKWESHR